LFLNFLKKGVDFEMMCSLVFIFWKCFLIPAIGKGRRFFMISKYWSGDQPIQGSSLET